MHTTDLNDLERILRGLGIPRRAVVMIHSSLLRFGRIVGGVTELLRLIDRLFDGTVVMPAFNWDFPTTKEWDSRTTPSQSGIMTERFRQTFYSRRSVHPFHSVCARGPLAEDIVAGVSTTSFGPSSPFARLYDLGAYNLSLGADFVGGATFLHMVEEECRVPYRFVKHFEGKVYGGKGQQVHGQFGMFVRIVTPTFEWINVWDHVWDDLQRHFVVTACGPAPILCCHIPTVHDALKARIENNPLYAAHFLDKRNP